MRFQNTDLAKINENFVRYVKWEDKNKSDYVIHVSFRTLFSRNKVSLSEHQGVILQSAIRS